MKSIGKKGKHKILTRPVQSAFETPSLIKSLNCKSQSFSSKDWDGFSLDCDGGIKI